MLLRVTVVSFLLLLCPVDLCPTHPPTPTPPWSFKLQHPTPSVAIFGDGPFKEVMKVKWGYKDRAWSHRISIFFKEVFFLKKRYQRACCLSLPPSLSLSPFLLSPSLSLSPLPSPPSPSHYSPFFLSLSPPSLSLFPLPPLPAPPFPSIPLTLSLKAQSKGHVNTEQDGCFL